jgi:dihydrofolate synthase / folylpolyglutamate synthase
MTLLSYQEVLDYLYKNLPMYQRVGAVAYKADLNNTIALCDALGNPQNKFRSIHVAGTNGKGSSSHMLAAILQSAGYKTGLYTSPHLKEFTERIKINGQEVEQGFVVDFVNTIKPSIEKIKPSFFEITVAMAFEYFAKQKVDIAVIEVGLGGRLDSTNVITPLVSLITNISWDHKEILGDTLPKIAFEKAGIIKKNIPVVISERQKEVDFVFQEKAKAANSSVIFASDELKVMDQGNGNFIVRSSGIDSDYQLDLKGSYQRKNLSGVLTTINILRDMGLIISDNAVKFGLSSTITLTGLKGRWQKLNDKPLIVCDTGHNEAGVQEVLSQIGKQKFDKLHVVWGMVNDKDITAILKLLPGNATYYFCQAKIPRAMPAQELMIKANEFGLHGIVVNDVNEAIMKAKQSCSESDMIFIGGSTFVVAEINNLQI